MKTFLFAAAAMATMLAATAAQADITYLASRAVGTGYLELSITTDGTIGVIDDQNIVGWDITVSDGGDIFQIQTNNSTHRIDGVSLSATATDLLFNFDGAGFALFQNPAVGSSQHLWCVQTSGCFDNAGPAEAIDAHTNFNFTREARTGNIAIASAAVTSAAPEPAAWALMIGGFGLAGGALRRRKAVAA